MQQEMEGAVLAVKVSSPGVGEEEPVVGQERWEEMRRLKAARHDGVGDCARDGAGSQDGASLSAASALAAVPAAGAREGLLDAHREWLDERGAAGRVLGAHPVPGAVRAARLRGRLRDGARRRAAAAAGAAAARSRNVASRPSRASRRRSTGVRFACRWARRWSRCTSS